MIFLQKLIGQHFSHEINSINVDIEYNQNQFHLQLKKVQKHRNTTDHSIFYRRTNRNQYQPFFSTTL